MMIGLRRSLKTFCCAVLCGCGLDVRGDDLGGTGGSSETTGAALPDPITTGQGDTGGPEIESTSSSSGEEDAPIFDVGTRLDLPGTEACEVAEVLPCDHLDDDPWHAIGLNCPGSPQVTGSQDGDDDAFFVHAGNIGTYVPAPYPPQEGEKVLLMSTGVAEDFLDPTATLESEPFGNLSELPEPIDPVDVSRVADCTDNPALIGDGDCSNSIQEQLDQGYNVWDYAEMRFTAEVPSEASALSFQFVFWSTEYPWWYQTAYNDIFIAWLESEQWTGNIAFDEDGNPVSINAAFLDYKDHYNEVECPDGCVQEAPELQGTAMEGHGGTRWLTTTAPVTPGEDVEVVFAIFDVSDRYLDSIVALDNVRWTCDDGPPVTVPEG